MKNICGEFVFELRGFNVDFSALKIYLMEFRSV
jgi:hypothetical protein